MKKIDDKWVISLYGTVYEIIDRDKMLGIKLRCHDGDLHYNMWVNGKNLSRMYLRPI